MTNWLEEKEKGLERLEQECADCVCCRDFECRLTDRKIEKIKAEIESYKRGVADMGEKYLDAIEKLIIQAGLCDFKDELEHRLLMNSAYINLRNLFNEAHIEIERQNDV